LCDRPSDDDISVENVHLLLPSATTASPEDDNNISRIEDLNLSRDSTESTESNEINPVDESTDENQEIQDFLPLFCVKINLQVLQNIHITYRWMAPLCTKLML